MSIRNRLIDELGVAETKAWDSLARYKFQMFGYWAAIWVHLNRLGGFRRPNPWRGLTAVARLSKKREPNTWACGAFVSATGEACSLKSDHVGPHRFPSGEAR